MGLRHNVSNILSVIQKTRAVTFQCTNSKQKPVQGSCYLPCEKGLSSDINSLHGFFFFSQIFYGEGISPGKQRNSGVSKFFFVFSFFFLHWWVVPVRGVPLSQLLCAFFQMWYLFHRLSICYLVSSFTVQSPWCEDYQVCISALPNTSFTLYWVSIDRTNLLLNDSWLATGWQAFSKYSRFFHC